MTGAQGAAIRVVLAGLAAALAPAPAGAAMLLCNEMRQPVDAALAWHNRAAGTWVIKGWVAVDPGRCVPGIQGDLPARDEYFYYGITRDARTQWDGPKRLCVRTGQSFDFQLPNGREGQCAWGDRSGGLAERGYRPIRTGGAPDFRVTFRER